MLADKLQEFYDALVAIKTALIAKGVVVSQFTLDLIAGLVGQIQTQRNMGSKSVEFKQNIVTYGFKVTEGEYDPTNRITYLDDAVGMVPITMNLEDGSVDYGTWKDSWIFDKVYPVMLKSNGSIGYKLNPDDQTKKATYGSSDISNESYSGNAMVCFERFYTKFSMDENNNEEIRISNVKQDGYIPMGFVREDDSEAPNFFIQMFPVRNIGNKGRSIAGGIGRYNISYSDARTHAQANGNGYDIENYVSNLVINVMVTTLIKSLDTFKCFNQCGNSKYDSGILSQTGAFGFDPTTNVSKVLWIENYMSGWYLWLNGIVWEPRNSTEYLFLKLKPPYPNSGTSLDGFNFISDFVPLPIGDVSTPVRSMKCSNEYGRIPVYYSTDYEGYKHYDCCSWSRGNQTTMRHIGQHGGGNGLFGIDLSGGDTASEPYSYRLTYLPPN